VIRKVIKIAAADSPNVRAGRRVFPGVLTLEEYEERRRTWDIQRQTVGLDAEFYKGPQLLLYPESSLKLCAEQFEKIKSTGRKGAALGVDSAEGGDNSAWVPIDWDGIIEVIGEKTPDTAKINPKTLELMSRYSIPGNKVGYDKGGGGQQHVDNIRLLPGCKEVQAIFFGDSVKPEIRQGQRTVAQRKEDAEKKQEYKNLRALMYGELAKRLDPIHNPVPFAIPGPHYGPAYARLWHQLSKIPKLRDAENVMYMLPKRSVTKSHGKKTPSLTDLLGMSPDEADALVIAYHLMTRVSRRRKAKAY